MFELTLKAIFTGLILSLMIGPAFFLLLETSIKKGVRAALLFDAGILVSDLVCITIAFIFYAEVAKITGKHEEVLKMIGGTLFIVYGLVSFFKKAKIKSQEEIEATSFSSKEYAVLFLKGMMLNLVNPMVVFYWFSVMAVGTKSGANDSWGSIYFIGVLLLVFFSIDFLKIIGAKKLRPFITDAVLSSLNKITGSILFLFGVVLLLQGILEKF